jgi:hypothetical protein
MTTKRIYPSPRRIPGNEYKPIQYRDRCCAKVIVIGEHSVEWRKHRYGEEDWDRCTRPATVVIDDRAFCTRHGGELALSKLLGEKDPFRE